jgi:hypothetical protein
VPEVRVLDPGQTETGDRKMPDRQVVVPDYMETDSQPPVQHLGDLQDMTPASRSQINEEKLAMFRERRKIATERLQKALGRLRERAANRS